MKRKDDLLRLAFDELGDDAARAVEARADAAERQEIAAFRELRQGLQHLPPPPPDGLSAERLRAAILDRELRARPKPFAWGPALFMPAAVAALAAIVLLPRLRPRSEPQIVALNDAPISRADVPAFRSFKPMRDAFGASSAVAKSKAEARVQTQDASPKPRLARRQRRRTDEMDAVTEPQEKPMYTFSVPSPVEGDATPPPQLALARREPQTIAAPVSSVVEGLPGKGGSTETVVMVSNQRDLETGALAATEKEVGSVLVGG